MKPANFPGRKNDRRMVALLHMKPPPAGLSWAEIAEHPYTILQSRIVPDAVARATRTKKALADASPERRARHKGKLR